MSEYGNIKVQKAFRWFIIALVYFGLIAGVFYKFYTTHATKTVTVLAITTQQRISGDNGSVSTHYEYIVSTDCGLYKIQPSGIFASQSFGQIHEGERYTIETIGFSVPWANIYPYILKAEGGKQ